MQKSQQKTPIPPEKQQNKRSENSEVSESAKAVLRSYEDYLRGKRLSESTVKTYYTFVLKFVAPINEPISKLLNHSRPETTMIYTRVQKKDLLQIKSPLDRALAGFKKMLPDKPNKNMGLSGDIYE